MKIQKISSIDEYIALQPLPVRAGLKKLKQLVKKAAPKAEEVISYGMPAFKFHGMLVYFAVYKHHYGFYPMPKALLAFKNKLTNYETLKGTVRFPIGKPLPEKLISDLVKFRAKEILEKKLLKEIIKKKTKK